MKKLIFSLLAVFLLASAPNIENNAQAYGESAIDYFNLGMQSSMAYKKIEYFTKALELNPRLALAYEKRGLFYYFQEKYDKVIEDYTRYIRLVPDKADAYRLLGMAYLKVGNNDKAVVNFDSAINMAPEMSAAFSYRAEALRLSYQLEGALQDATRAIGLNGDPRTIADAYKTRGKVYQELGEESLADADFKRSVELDPRLVFYNFFSSYASLDAMRNAGFFGMVGIAFVLVFGYKIKPPQKDE